MPYNRLSTAKIAKAVGCHPNTVRLYEQIGFIAPVKRSPKGYRLYTPAHLDQMRLARLAMNTVFPGPNIRRSAIELVRCTAKEDYEGALELAHHHLNVVLSERWQAEAAVDFLEQWAKGIQPEPAPASLQIGQTARLLDLTIDMMRNWERSGLLNVPRDPSNGYRRYGAAEIGRLRVIRLLRQTGYSPMAILRMLVELDQGESVEKLRIALDTPRPDEDVYQAADRWLSTLTEMEQIARELLVLAEENLRKYGE